MEKKSKGIIPNCKEVHRLVSEAMDRDLSLSEHIRVRMHLLICVGCSRFEHQMGMLRGALRSFPAPDDDKENK